MAWKYSRPIKRNKNLKTWCTTIWMTLMFSFKSYFIIQTEKWYNHYCFQLEILYTTNHFKMFLHIPDLCFLFWVGQRFVKYPAINKINNYKRTNFARTFLVLFHCILVTPLACQEPLGIESGNVTSDQFTASSFNGSFVASNAILNQQGAWVPATNDQHQWLQIDLHRQVLISGVMIQGRPDFEEWVTTYHVEYALYGSSWELVKDENTKTEVRELSPNLSC